MKILAIDIETAPALLRAFGIRKQYIGIHQIVEPTRMLCFAACWIGERGSMEFHSEWGDGHEAMVRAAHELLDQADVVLHWNGERFDTPHLRREFLEAGLAPPSPFKQIDLLRTARQFEFMSHKLEFVSRRLGLDGKLQHEGLDLWLKTMAGDERAQRKMQRYNVQDVRLLEQSYRRLLPWIPGHPSVPLHSDGAIPKDCCPRCGSCHVQRRGTAKTQVSSFPQYQCQDCHGWFRGSARVGSVSRSPIAA